MDNLEMQMKTIFDHMKLVDVTTERQKLNGTAMYMDKLKNHTVYYTFHKSGYFRRRVPTGYFQMTGRSFEHYQLNRTRKVMGNGYHMHTVRILEYNRGKQMLLAISAITNYRLKNV